MNKFILSKIMMLFAVMLFAGCKEEIDLDALESPYIEGLTFNNYPLTDCSTSAKPLNTLVACKLLGLETQWKKDIGSGEWYIQPTLLSSDNHRRFREKIKSTTTHYSFINLIDKKADLIFVARKTSEDEKAYADSVGVELIETPIALDAFIFIVHPDNPVKSLTIEQIQDIYTAKILNWKEVGGNDAAIEPFIRNANSGSQELMESLVMQGLDMQDFFSVYNEFKYTIRDMSGALRAVSNDMEPNAICYTLHYYKEQMIKSENTKTIAIDGVYPDEKSIVNNSYPFVEPVYAVIRSDMDIESPAYKICKWLQTEFGKNIIRESGYPAN